MRPSATVTALLVLLLAAAGGATAAKHEVAPQAVDHSHGKGAPVQSPTPAPAPAPAPAPVPQPQAPTPAASAPQATVPVATSEPQPVPSAAPILESAAAAQPAAPSDLPWRLHDPTMDPGLVESSMPVLLGAAVPVPAGSSPWAAILLGVVAVGAVFSVGMRPLGVPRVPPPQKSVRLNVVPADVDSLLRAAQAAVAANKLAEGIAWLDMALSLKPNLPVAHFCRGVCLGGLGRHAEARDALRRAVELDPTEGAYRLELARACGRTGEANEAMAHLAPILSALPEIAQDVAEDEAFAGLKDHPHFLALVGLL